MTTKWCMLMNLFWNNVLSSGTRYAWLNISLYNDYWSMRHPSLKIFYVHRHCFLIKKVLLPSGQRRNSQEDRDSEIHSMNRLWDPFGRLIVLLPGVKVCDEAFWSPICPIINAFLFPRILLLNSHLPMFLWKANILRHCLQIIYCGESNVSTAKGDLTDKVSKLCGFYHAE